MRREEQPPGWSKNGQEAGRTREGKGTRAGLGKGGHIAAAAAHSAPAVANRHCLVPRECAMQCKGIASNETKNVGKGRVEKSHTHAQLKNDNRGGVERDGEPP